MIQRTMENLPFLAKSEESKSARPQSPSEWPQQNAEPMFVPQFAPPRESNPATDLFKNMNPMAILLLGIVIGVIVVSMRPIVIQPK